VHETPMAIGVIKHLFTALFALQHCLSCCVGAG
jgi:hypothetical protein